MAPADVGAIRQRAQARAAAGDQAGGRAIYAAALRTHPKDLPLLNSAGNFHANLGDLAAALRLFDEAAAMAPDDAEVLLNRAVVLSRTGRADEGLPDLRRIEPEMQGMARYWSVRASLERAIGDLDAAAASYDRCLALDGTHQRAQHGRARTALERGEADAHLRFEQALLTQKGDAQLWLGYAQALDDAGEAERALAIAHALVRQAPGWTDALRFLSELMWARGERDTFCQPSADAARVRPDDRALTSAWCEMLAGVDRHAEAADVAGAAARRLGDDQSLLLAEAAYAGAAGDDERAERIFASLEQDDAARLVQEARHRLRRREAERADHLLERALSDRPDAVAAWALRDLAWRLLDDPRHAWLHGQEGLVQFRNTGMEPLLIDELAKLMHRLHDRGSTPLGQSIRAGTQTRGGLFDRHEPEIRRALHQIRLVLDDYRAGLPAADARHPLLRHREAMWGISGSWSIRARRSGHHTAHIHPQGLLSSAFYLSLPEDVEEKDAPGALELGRPPSDLRLDLPPVATLRPSVGSLALFPSTLYHGTRPFAKGERMTIAFDVALRD